MTASLIPRVILRAQLQTCQKNSPLNQRFQTHFDFQQAIEKLGVRVLGPIRKLEPDPIVCKHKVSMRRCVGCHNQENDILCFWSHSYPGCFLSHDYKDINYSGDNVCYALFCCCWKMQHLFIFKQFFLQNPKHRCDCCVPDGCFDTKIDKNDKCHIFMTYASYVIKCHIMTFDIKIWHKSIWSILGV